MNSPPHIAVVIPSFRVTNHIIKVLERIGPECRAIYVVDDACPDSSGRFVEDNYSDPRVKVLYHQQNQGVGGATITGIRQALADGAEVIVKVDGDGQMDPSLIPTFVAPILAGVADYTKGNRFFNVEGLAQMPVVRLVGNAVLSFVTKLSSGYWDLFDPTNGYVAIHRAAAGAIPLEKVSHHYFFESDMLFRLNTYRAVVVEIPMRAQYGDEVSGLRPFKIMGTFVRRHLVNGVKRLLYNYFVRDFSLASLHLLIGLPLLLFGIGFGFLEWWNSFSSGVAATAGTVMLSALPTIVGLQLVLSFFAFDMRPVTGPPLQMRMKYLDETEKGRL